MDAGKRLIASMLLEQEREARPVRDWYSKVFEHMADGVSSPADFPLRNNVTFVTYNYDRSLERFLMRALQTKFPGHEPPAYVAAIEGRGVHHLHGALGRLPDMVPVDPSEPTHSDEFRQRERGLVPYGGTSAGITDWDLLIAARGIKIVHEAADNAATFDRALDAIAGSECVVFLGFGFAPRNVERLRLRECLHLDAQIYMSARDFSEDEP